MNEIISLILFGSLLFVMLAGIIMAFMIIHRQQVQRLQLEMKETSHRYQNELLQTRIEVQEQGFSRISREIHDNIGQTLSIIRMQLGSPGNLNSAEEMRQFMLEAGLAMEKSIKDLRELSHLLNGELIEKLDLPVAIEKELSHIKSLYGVNYSFDSFGEIPAARNGQNLLLFRIIQEALTNILKHAEATEIILSLFYQNNSLKLKIIDNGKGFNHLAPQNGLGLMNIRHRTKLLRGRLNIHSVLGLGTSILITINPFIYERPDY